MFGARPEVRLKPAEIGPIEIRLLQDSAFVSQITRALGLLLDAAGPVRPMASAVVLAAVA